MRGLQIRHSHIFTFYSHVYNRRRLQQPSGTSGSLSHEGSMNEQSAVIFAPGGDLFPQTSWPSSLCFRVAVCHLRLPKVSAEGLALRPFAPDRRFVSFAHRRLSPKVLVFKPVLLSDPSSPSGTLTLLSLEHCKRVREHFRGWELDPEVQSPTSTTKC